MKIVIAPDSFKESLSALDVARAIADGFRTVYPTADLVTLPVADGGEGTVEAMVAATNGRIIPLTVTGPLGAPVAAFYGLTGDGAIAVIEMAAAAGLMLVPQAARDPRITTTQGVGEILKAALDAGARHVIIGIGGSATNDGGAGMLHALGARLLDAEGRDLPPGGAALARLACIDVSHLDSRLRTVRIDVACDVDNPLVGPKGASAVFGPQKGATPAMVAELDAALATYAEVIARDLGADIATLPGSGAAGGLGGGLAGVLGAHLKPGVDIVLEAVDLDAIVRDADLVVTGEGRMDFQTVHGKTPIGVARVAKRHGKPVIAIAGSFGRDVEAVHDHGIDAAFSVLDRICTLEEALADGAANLTRTARNVAATLKLGGLGA